jgi:hypothetical protein
VDGEEGWGWGKEPGGTVRADGWGEGGGINGVWDGSDGFDVRVHLLVGVEGSFGRVEGEVVDVSSWTKGWGGGCRVVFVKGSGFGGGELGGRIGRGGSGVVGSRPRGRFGGGWWSGGRGRS